MNIHSGIEVYSEMKLCDWYEKNNTDIRNGKILVAGQTGNGISLFYQLAEETGGVIGIECKTSVNIAFPIVTEKLTAECTDIIQLSSVKRIDDDMAANIIMSLISEHIGELPYDEKSYASPEEFHKHIHRILTKETADEIMRICSMIRMNRLESRLRSLSECNLRLQRLLMVISFYEDYLQKHNMYDNTRLLREAVEYLKSCGGKCPALIPQYARLNDHVPTVLEDELLKLLCKGKAVPVIEAETGCQPKMSFFNAYGMADEIRCIAGDIKQKGIYPGEVSIYCSEPSYHNVIKGVMSSEGLEVCFTDGYTAEAMESFILFQSVMDWIGNEYRSQYFEKLLYNSAIELRDNDGEKISKSSIMNYLDMVGYLFDRQPYELLAKPDNIAEKNYLAAAADQTDHDRRKKKADAIRNFLKELLKAAAPDEENKYLLHSFMKRMMEFFRKFRIKSGLACKEFPLADNELKKILSALETGSERLYSFKEAEGILKSILSSVSIRDEDDRNKISVHNLSQQLTAADRKHSYITGMSSDLLLRKTDDSPVMLDSEIRECFENAEQLAERYCGSSKNDRIKKAVMYLMNTHTEGSSITFSYPCYDQAKLRARPVSGIFEELRGDCKLSEYNTLDMENDKFLYHAEKAENTAAASSEKKYVDNIIEYLTLTRDTLSDKWEEEKKKSSNERKSKDQFSLSDEEKAKIFSSSEWEKRDREYKLSASSFDTLLQCPRKYSFTYLYGLSPEPHELSEQMDWLDALKRGSFFHRLMELYYLEKCGREGKKVIDISVFDADAFEKAFNDTMKENELIPYPFEQKKAIEAENIKKAALNYLESLAKENEKYYTIAAELLWNEDISDTIELSSDTDETKKYFLANYYKGFIDRLDKRTDTDGKTHYRITDYKTGRIKTFIEHHRYLLVQHYVYEKALRKIWKDIKDDDSIVFVFVFPTDNSNEQYMYENGEFVLTDDKASGVSSITIRDFALTEQIRKLLKDFLDTPVHELHSYGEVGSILYPQTDEPEDKNAFRHDCDANCDYKAICRGCINRGN